MPVQMISALQHVPWTMEDLPEPVPEIALAAESASSPLSLKNNHMNESLPLDEMDNKNQPLPLKMNEPFPLKMNEPLPLKKVGCSYPYIT